MAKVYKCDRCGKIFGLGDYSKNYYSAQKVVRKHLKYGHNTGAKFSLCPKCSEKLDRWLYKPANKEQNNG